MPELMIRDMRSEDEYFVSTCSHVGESDEIDACAAKRRELFRDLADKGGLFKVALLDGEAETEKVLFHWEKSAYMVEGDGLRQGIAGFGEIYFLSDGTEIRLFGEAHLFVTVSRDGQHVVQFREMTRSISIAFILLIWIR